MDERIGFGLYQACGTCLYLSSSGVGGVGGEWEGGMDVKSCCTISISASYRVFVYGRLVCEWFKVVGPGFVSTSPTFIRNSASHPAGRHGRFAKKVNQAPIAGGRRFRHNLHSSL